MTPQMLLPGQVAIGPRRVLGAISSQVIYLEASALYVIACVDRFGIDGTFVGFSEPNEAVIVGAMERQSRISQVVTRRN